MKKTSFDIRLPQRAVDISHLSSESAEPEEALLLLSPQTNDDLLMLPDRARLEVRDMLFELGRAMQNTAFPTLRIDLDLELEPPQDWVASVALEGQVVRSFTHSDAEGAYAMAVLEGVIQATSLGIKSRSAMLAAWSMALGAACEALDGISTGLRADEEARNMENMAAATLSKLEMNPEGDDAD